MVIDTNMYWFPEEVFSNDGLMQQFISEIPQGYGMKGYSNTVDRRKQIVIEKPKGYQNLNYIQGEYLLENQLRDMDEAGIDKSVLKVPGCHEWMSLSTCRWFNDAMAEHVRKSNGRMAALAVVPPWGISENLNELERCKYELGMKGVQLCAHYGNLYLDDEAFEPLLQKLNELEMTIYIHHTPVPVQFDSIYQHNNLRRSYGRCMDQMIAIGRELFSNLFGKYPKLKFVHSMLGGGFFAYVNMMLPPKPESSEQVNRFDTDNATMRSYLENNLFFEISHAQPWGKSQLECAIKIFGAEHVLFGSSYPVRKEWLVSGADFVRQLNISENEKDMILYENARKLYGL